VADDAENEPEAEAAKGGGKKKIIMVVVALLLGAFVAKSMFLKPPPPTQAELDLAKKVETLEIWAMCAAENEQPFDVEAAEAEIVAQIEREHELADEAEELGTAGEAGAAPAVDPARPGGGPGPGGLGIRAVAARPAEAGGGGASHVDPVYENEPVTLNLADGTHYVKIRVALQLGPGVDVEALGINNFGSRAQDLVNTRLRGLTMEQLQAPEAVTALKKELGNPVCRDYYGEVTTIYFAEFVTQ
jgi:flagellar basal body-associated protein FliL